MDASTGLISSTVQTANSYACDDVYTGKSISTSTGIYFFALGAANSAVICQFANGASNFDCINPTGSRAVRVFSHISGSIFSLGFGDSGNSVLNIRKIDFSLPNVNVWGSLFSKTGANTIGNQMTSYLYQSKLYYGVILSWDVFWFALNEADGTLVTGSMYEHDGSCAKFYHIIEKSGKMYLFFLCNSQTRTYITIYDPSAEAFAESFRNSASGHKYLDFEVRFALKQLISKLAYYHYPLILGLK